MNTSMQDGGLKMEERSLFSSLLFLFDFPSKGGMEKDGDGAQKEKGAPPLIFLVKNSNEKLEGTSYFLHLIRC